jgi:hypothetical protein
VPPPPVDRAQRRRSRESARPGEQGQDEAEQSTDEQAKSSAN